MLSDHILHCCWHQQTTWLTKVESNTSSVFILGISIYIYLADLHPLTHMVYSRFYHFQYLCYCNVIWILFIYMYVITSFPLIPQIQQFFDVTRTSEPSNLPLSHSLMPFLLSLPSLNSAIKSTDWHIAVPLTLSYFVVLRTKKSNSE